MSAVQRSHSWPSLTRGMEGENTAAEPCPETGVQTTTLILGLGNDILSDDAVGLRVAAGLQRRLGARRDVEVRQVCEMGLALLDLIVGCREAILVDSIQTDGADPGTLREFDAADLRTRRGASPHFLGVGETLELGRLLGLAMPERVRILAIEVADPFTLGTDLTPAVAAAVGPATERVLAWVGANGD